MGDECVPEAIEPCLLSGVPGSVNLILPSRLGSRRFGCPLFDLAAASSLQGTDSRETLGEYRLLDQTRIDRWRRWQHDALHWTELLMVE
jgi:hypothetical protein